MAVIMPIQVDLRSRARDRDIDEGVKHADRATDISLFAKRITLPERLTRTHYHNARTTGMSAKCVRIL